MFETGGIWETTGYGESGERRQRPPACSAAGEGRGRWGRRRGGEGEGRAGDGTAFERPTRAKAVRALCRADAAANPITDPARSGQVLIARAWRAFPRYEIYQLAFHSTRLEARLTSGAAQGMSTRPVARCPPCPNSPHRAHTTTLLAGRADADIQNAPAPPFSLLRVAPATASTKLPRSPAFDDPTNAPGRPPRESPSSIANTSLCVARCASEKFVTADALFRGSEGLDDHPVRWQMAQWT